MSNSRVTDGVRTRDNRNHNPPVKKTYRDVTRGRGSQKPADSRGGLPIPVPGPGSLAPGREVRVTRGLAQGLVGELVQRSTLLFGDLAMWEVAFPLPLGVRTIRADYLEVAS
jgi:hypothetical protein